MPNQTDFDVRIALNKKAAQRIHELERRLGITPVVGLDASRVHIVRSPAFAALLFHLCVVATSDDEAAFVHRLALGHLANGDAVHEKVNSLVALTNATIQSWNRFEKEQRSSEVGALLDGLSIISTKNLVVPGDSAESDRLDTASKLEEWRASTEAAPMLRLQQALLRLAIDTSQLFAVRMADQPPPVIEWRSVSLGGSGDADRRDSLVALVVEAIAQLDQLRGSKSRGRSRSQDSTIIERLCIPGLVTELTDLRTSLASAITGADVKFLCEAVWHSIRVIHPIPPSSREVGFAVGLGLGGEGGKAGRLLPHYVGGSEHGRRWYRGPDDQDDAWTEVASVVAAQQAEHLDPLGAELQLSPVNEWLASQVLRAWHERVRLESENRDYRDQQRAGRALNAAGVVLPSEGHGAQHRGRSDDPPEQIEIPFPIILTNGFDLAFERRLCRDGQICHSLIPVVMSTVAQVNDRPFLPVIRWVLATHTSPESVTRPSFGYRDAERPQPAMRGLSLQALGGPLVIRLAGSPLVDLGGLRMELTERASATHMVAAGEIEGLAIAATIGGLAMAESPQKDGGSMGGLRPPGDPRGDDPAVTTIRVGLSDIWGGGGDQPRFAQIEALPKACLTALGVLSKGNRGPGSSVPSDPREWVFVGPVLSDWSTRSQLYFLPPFAWGARAHRMSVVDADARANVFDWSFDDHERFTLSKLRVEHVLACDLDLVFREDASS